MGEVIYIEEWKKRKQAERMWAKMEAAGCDTEGLQEMWERGEIFLMTHSANFPVTMIETISCQDLENATLGKRALACDPV